MIFRTRIPAVLAAVALLATAACESATYSDPVANGTVTFSFAGTDNGSFSATGGYDRLRPSEVNWAVGSRGVVQGGGEVLAVYARTARGTGSRVNEFILFVENPQVGTFTCTADQETCPVSGFLILGTTPTGEEAETIYTSLTGTVNIVSVSEDFAQGSFSLSMEEIDLVENPATVQVTSGTFNVPLISAADL